MATVLKSATVVTERPRDFCPKCWELIRGRLLMAEFEMMYRPNYDVEIRHEQDHWQSEKHPVLSPLVATVAQRCRPLRSSTGEPCRNWWLPKHEINAGLTKENVRRQDDGTYTGTYHLSVINVGIKRGYHRALVCDLPDGVLSIVGPMAEEYITEQLAERDRLIIKFQADIDKELAQRQAKAEQERQHYEEGEQYETAIRRFAQAAGVEAGITATFLGAAMSISREDLDRVSEKLERLNESMAACVEQLGTLDPSEITGKEESACAHPGQQ